MRILVYVVFAALVSGCGTLSRAPDTGVYRTYDAVYKVPRVTRTSSTLATKAGCMGRPVSTPAHRARCGLRPL
jgi:hypothetical protein